jgi:hypothetical protein
MFYVALGASAGVLAVRRLTQLANRWTPEGIAAQAGGVGERIADWWQDVQRFAAAREDELREALGLDDADAGDAAPDPAAAGRS